MLTVKSPLNTVVTSIATTSLHPNYIYYITTYLCVSYNSQKKYISIKLWWYVETSVIDKLLMNTELTLLTNRKLNKPLSKFHIYIYVISFIIRGQYRYIFVSLAFWSIRTCLTKLTVFTEVPSCLNYLQSAQRLPRQRSYTEYIATNCVSLFCRA